MNTKEQIPVEHKVMNGVEKMTEDYRLEQYARYVLNIDAMLDRIAEHGIESEEDKPHNMGEWKIIWDKKYGNSDDDDDFKKFLVEYLSKKVESNLFVYNLSDVIGKLETSPKSVNSTKSKGFGKSKEPVKQKPVLYSYRTIDTAPMNVFFSKERPVVLRFNVLTPSKRMRHISKVGDDTVGYVLFMRESSEHEFRKLIVKNARPGYNPTAGFEIEECLLVEDLDYLIDYFKSDGVVMDKEALALRYI